jgi:tRNA(fMet)-specific endonuclease VapC
MTYLLDTDICIYWLKNIDYVRNKIQAVGWKQICICDITVAELYFGAYNSQRVTENLTRAEKFIENITVISLDQNSLKRFGELKAELRKIGQPVADFDLLIASVALTKNYILVTNNTRHYSRISELQLENWI